MATATVPTTARPRLALAGVLVLGLAVSLSLGVYARVHTPAERPLFTLGFSGTLQMKTWLATIALFFILIQLVTALWMWGKLPKAGAAPPWAAIVHRWSGSIGFVITLPVVFHCVWSLGFVTTTPRVLVHSLAGCAFYGAYAAKMLGLRTRGLPGWVLPVLGGTVLSTFLVLWLTAALWFFTRTSLPLF
jgi:Family of unknown function (DUF6529)